MSYNNIFLCGLLVLLVGCSTTTPPSNALSNEKKQVSAPKNEVDTDIATYALAMADIKLGKFDKARTLLNQLTSKHPELAGPWANLALIDIRQNNLNKAKVSLQKAIKRDPAMPQAYNMLGYIDKQQGNIGQAIKDYQEAIAKKSNYALAQYNLALLYDIYLQDVPNAVKHYKRYLALTGNQDQRTADWVKELESSLKRGNP